MNANFFHNILNVATAVIGVASAVMVATGCTANALGALDCSASIVSPAYAGVAVAAIAGLKLGINVVRDGVGGLAKPQPPVEK